MLTYVLSGVAVVLVLFVLYLATRAPVRAAVKQAVTQPSAPALCGPVLAPSHEQLLARLVTPAFEDAVDKRRATRLYNAMLDSYVAQRHPDEASGPAPATSPPVPPTPVAK